MKKVLLTLMLVVAMAAAAAPSRAGRINNPDGSVSLTVKLGDSPADSAAAIQALAVYFGYTPMVDGSPNPETRSEFVERAIRELVISAVREGRAAAAARTARETEDAKPLPIVQ